MTSKQIKLNCPLGLTVEPAGILCKEAVNYKCSINIEYDGGVANAKSMLNLLGAALRNGDELCVVCDGEDETLAINSISEILSERFV